MVICVAQRQTLLAGPWAEIFLCFSTQFLPAAWQTPLKGLLPKISFEQTASAQESFVDGPVVAEYAQRCRLDTYRKAFTSDRLGCQNGKDRLWCQNSGGNPNTGVCGEKLDPRKSDTCPSCSHLIRKLLQNIFSHKS